LARPPTRHWPQPIRRFPPWRIPATPRRRIGEPCFRALRELDAGLLQTSTLSDLLTVRSREDPGPDGPLADMLWLMGSWLLGREQQPLVEKTIPHVTLRFRQLRTLLHLVDAEFGAQDEPSIPVRSRCTHTFRMLCERVRGDTVTPLRRLTCAILARAADAVVREQVYELSDAFIAACWCVRSAVDFRCLAEACMVPEFRELFAAMAEVALLVGERSGRHADESALVQGLRGVAEALPSGSSARVEGLRRGLLSITGALEAFTDAQCVSDLRRGDDGTALDRLAGPSPTRLVSLPAPHDGQVCARVSFRRHRRGVCASSMPGLNAPCWRKMRAWALPPQSLPRP